MPVVSPPLLIAALDAGSNAIPAVVARAPPAPPGAVREADTPQAWTPRTRRETGVELVAIDTREEARLARAAVFSAATSEFAPRAIVDPGGGSLEISFLR